MFHVPNNYRIRTGVMGSDERAGNNGAFEVACKHGQWVMVIASDGDGWEHVSVSRRDRCPVWDEMCQVKDMFWDPEDACVQFHPKHSEYVNVHPYCLHIWRPVGRDLDVPPRIFVG